MNASDFAELIRTFSIWMASNGMSLAFAAIPATIAAKKGWPAWLGFVAGLILHWVPAIILFSILPPRQRLAVGGQKGARQLDALEQERRRIEQAERRAAQGAGSRKASSPGAGETGSHAAVSPAALPPPAFQELPVDLHPDPLADAPRVSLRGEERKTAQDSSQAGA